MNLTSWLNLEAVLRAGETEFKGRVVEGRFEHTTKVNIPETERAAAPEGLLRREGHAERLFFKYAFQTAEGEYIAISGRTGAACKVSVIERMPREEGAYRGKLELTQGKIYYVR